MLRENLDLGEYNYGNLNNDTFERNEAENDKQEENMVMLRHFQMFIFNFNYCFLVGHKLGSL